MKKRHIPVPRVKRPIDSPGKNRQTSRSENTNNPVLWVLILSFIIMTMFFSILELKKCGSRGIPASKPKKTVIIAPDAAVQEKSFINRSVKAPLSGVKDYDIFVVKTDPFGKPQWTRTFGTPFYDWAEYAVQTDDGSYLLLARTYYSDEGECDFKVIKIDATGNTVWTKTLTGKDSSVVNSVAQAVDDGYIIAGKAYSGNVNDSEVYLAHTDRDGNYEWVQNFGREYYEWEDMSVAAGDGSYMTVGQAEAAGLSAGFYLRKRDKEGKYSWTKNYGGSGYDWAYSIAAAWDGGYVLAGLTYSFGAGLDDIYLVKADEEGNSVWAKTYGGAGYDEAFLVSPDPVGGFIVAGATSSRGKGGYDALLLRVDDKGNSLWSAVFGGQGDEAAYSASRTKDGGYILAGTSNSVWE
jgi:hypothetical protein